MKSNIVHLTELARWSAVGLRAMALLTIILGLAYPLAMWGVGSLIAHRQVTGSLVESDGRVVGSALIGQEFDGAEWLHSRPSANDYDAMSSGGTNLGPNSEELVDAVAARRAAIAAADHATDIPADALTASGSGLDPDISPEYAHQQEARIAEARGMAVEDVAAIIEHHTKGRFLGVLGEPRVNVLECNADLSQFGTDALE